MLVLKLLPLVVLRYRGHADGCGGPGSKRQQKVEEPLARGSKWYEYVIPYTGLSGFSTVISNAYTPVRVLVCTRRRGTPCTTPSIPCMYDTS